MKTINEQFEDMTTSEIQTFYENAKIMYGNSVIVSGYEIYDILTNIFGEYKTKDLKTSYQLFNSRNSKIFSFVYNNLVNSTYNPLYNYDKISNINTNNSDSTITSDTTYPDMTLTKSDKTYDSDNFKEIEKNVTNYDDKITVENKTEYDRIDNLYTQTVSESTHGNIGTLTTSEMLKKEFDLRISDYLIKYIRLYIDTYCYYCKGV